jgi:hypothetical protein
VAASGCCCCAARRRQCARCGAHAYTLTRMNLGYANLQQQWSILGEYSNPAMEELFDWVTKHTSKGERAR